MKIDFSQKRLDKYRPYFLVWSMATSHKFYQIFGEIEFTDFEKIGESPKNSPAIISGTVPATTTQLGVLKENIDPQFQYFFQNFQTKGWGTRSPPIFQKNRRGVNG
jgi:hypothetical protein